jgi:hypothetical protein
MFGVRVGDAIHAGGGAQAKSREEKTVQIARSNI